MKRVLATLAFSTMMFPVPTAALAGGKTSSGGETCTSKGANKGGTCNNNTVPGDNDGDGKVRYECRNFAGGLIVVNVANCTNILFPTLVIVDL